MMLEPLLYARGDTKPIEVTLRDRNGNPILPAGKIIRFTAKLAKGHEATSDADAVIAKSSADPDEIVHQGDGVYHVFPAAADTADLLEQTTLVFDVEIETIATGARETGNQNPDRSRPAIYKRTMIIVADVTRGV